jgi:flagellar hook-associated protein 1 FlgK
VESALGSAAARPDLEARQNQVVDRLSHLVDRVGDVARGIQASRAEADTGIATAVDRLNADLDQIAQLNTDIRKASVRGQNASALLDTRQNLIDRVSELVPVREIDRDHGMVALMSEGGMLLDGAAPTLGFQRTPVITAHHDLSAGLLSGISVNGQVVDTTRNRHLLSGGQLAALMDVRDSLAPAAQAELDGFARDLVERLAAPGVDPTLAASAPHLLTDAGSAFAAANETGLSARLTLNASVDPQQGGQVSRLRDGLGATTPGPVGDASGLTRLISALSSLAPPGSAALSGASRSAAGQASDLFSRLGTARSAADSAQAYARARHDGLAADLMADGVDSDAEMQKLLLIEQAYAANARVVSAAQSMLDVLMGI